MFHNAASAGLSVKSVGCPIYLIYFTGRGMVVWHLMLSSHSKKYTGLVTGLFWMEFLLFEFSSPVIAMV